MARCKSGNASKLEVPVLEEATQSEMSADEAESVEPARRKRRMNTFYASSD
jgi:hypothetical protein